MILLKKKVSVELEVLVRSESRDQERMNIEINKIGRASCRERV